MNRKFLIFHFIFIFVLSNVIFAGPQTKFISRNPSTANYLILADIHFNPFNACQGKIPCFLIQKLNQVSAHEWDQILQKYDSQFPKVKQDTNYHLLNTTLSFASKIAKENHVHSILVLGDLIGHDYHQAYKKLTSDKTFSGYQTFVKKTFQFLALQLNQAFPTQDIFFVMGNNDSNVSDYYIPQSGAFFKETADAWASSIKQENARKNFHQQFSNMGYYALNLPQDPKTRLIILNSVLFSNQVKGRNIHAIAEQELGWLARELKAVKNKDQKALIAMHIPPSMDIYATSRVRLFTLFKFWQNHYAQHFQSLIENYSNSIVGIFAAHMHSDNFYFLTFKNSNVEIPIFTVPSVSPVFGNNPSFKFYSFTTYALGENVTYYFPLANKRVWQMENKFAHLHLIPCRTCFFHQSFA